jgi:proteasome lid subunit RPN8/RPN11
VSAPALWRVWLGEHARAALIAAAAAAHPDETGGVLVGVVGHTHSGRGRPWVTHAVMVASPRSDRTHYELPARARERVVSKLRRRDVRLGYLGDWHSHPIDIDPSLTDATSIESISASGDCARPLLFIVRRLNGTYEIDARQWTGASLRRLQVVDAGPLPAASALAGKRRRRPPKLGNPPRPRTLAWPR